MNNSYNLITILGPTASGKTHLACQLASKIGGEIISADSRQIYREMDIGTGKDLEEYIIEGVNIPVHLIDIKPPGYKYNIAEYHNDFQLAFNEIRGRNNVPILCGGSGLYIDTALYGNSFLGIPTDESLWANLKTVTTQELDKQYSALPKEIKSQLSGNTIPRKIRAIEIYNFLKNNPTWQPLKTSKIKPIIFGVNIDRDLRRDKITKRLKKRLEEGLVEEVQFLLEKYLTFEDLEYYGLEYKWVGSYLKEEITRKELFERLEIAIHQFAKRQMTWFRRMEKKGATIHWLDASLPTHQKLNFIKQLAF